MKGKDRQPQKPKCFNIKLASTRWAKVRSLCISKYLSFTIHIFTNSNKTKKWKPKKKREGKSNLWNSNETIWDFCVWKRETEIWDESGFWLQMKEKEEFFILDRRLYWWAKTKKWEKVTRALLITKAFWELKSLSTFYFLLLHSKKQASQHRIYEMGEMNEIHTHSYNLTFTMTLVFP